MAKEIESEREHKQNTMEIITFFHRHRATESV